MHHASGKEEHNEKVLLKLSSTGKFSQNLNWNEDGSSSTTSLVCKPLLAFSIPLVWAIVLSVPKAMREACQLDKANIVPTPYFIMSFWGTKDIK